MGSIPISRSLFQKCSGTPLQWKIAKRGKLIMWVPCLSADRGFHRSLRQTIGIVYYADLFIAKLGFYLLVSWNIFCFSWYRMFYSLFARTVYKDSSLVVVSFFWFTSRGQHLAGYDQSFVERPAFHFMAAQCAFMHLFHLPF